MKKFSQALVTGATSGIGYSLAKLLAEKGIDLILTGRDKKKLEEFTSEKVKVTPIVARLEDPVERQTLIHTIQTQVPDLIVNNAGFGLYGRAIEHSLDKQLEMVEVNCKALLELTLVGAKALKDAGKRGVILNVSSVLGHLTSPGMSTYGATKSFVLLLSKALDYELAPFGIRILASCPGQVTTNFVTRAGKKSTTLRKGPLMSADFAAKKMWQQIIKEKKVDVFDWKYNLIAFLGRNIIPENWMNKILLTNGLKRAS